MVLPYSLHFFQTYSLPRQTKNQTLHSVTHISILLYVEIYASLFPHLVAKNLKIFRKMFSQMGGSGEITYDF